jgi:ParB family chromosome partitioning protein
VRPQPGVPLARRAAEGLGLVLEFANPRDLIIDDNVRTEVKLDPGLVKSIRERGVRQPVLGRRDQHGSLVISLGQCRVLTAIEADVKLILVVVEPDDGLTGDKAVLERMFDQLAENDHRVPVGAADEVRAVQQMIGMGVPAGTIVRRRHMPRGRVRQAMRVANSNTARLRPPSRPPRSSSTSPSGCATTGS